MIFQHLAWIRNHVAEPERIAFCFDTCHITAAGYDMSTPTKARAVLDEFDEIAGIENIHVFHFNDSIGALGSRLDRHTHIGQGTCGLSCFRAIIEQSESINVPKVLRDFKRGERIWKTYGHGEYCKVASHGEFSPKTPIDNQIFQVSYAPMTPLPIHIDLLFLRPCWVSCCFSYAKRRSKNCESGASYRSATSHDGCSWTCEGAWRL